MNTDDTVRVRSGVEIGASDDDTSDEESGAITLRAAPLSMVSDVPLPHAIGGCCTLWSI